LVEYRKTLMGDDLDMLGCFYPTPQKRDYLANRKNTEEMQKGLYMIFEQ
jgi:hypothetical protein